MRMEEELAQRKTWPLGPLQTSCCEAPLACEDLTPTMQDGAVLASEPGGICLRLLPRRIMLLAWWTAPGGLRRMVEAYGTS